MNLKQLYHDLQKNPILKSTSEDGHRIETMKQIKEILGNSNSVFKNQIAVKKLDSLWVNELQQLYQVLRIQADDGAPQSELISQVKDFLTSVPLEELDLDSEMEQESTKGKLVQIFFF